MDTTTSIGTIFGTVAADIVDQASEVVANVLPVGLTLVAIVIAVTFGMKFIRKVTKG